MTTKEFTLLYQPSSMAMVSMRLKKKISFKGLTELAFSFLPDNYELKDKEIVVVRKTGNYRFVVRYPIFDKSDNDPVFPIFQHKDEFKSCSFYKLHNLL
jgi:hypothetical protein